MLGARALRGLRLPRPHLGEPSPHWHLDLGLALGKGGSGQSYTKAPRAHFVEEKRTLEIHVLYDGEKNIPML